MSQYRSQVQNHFLSQARKRHQKVEVVLETGTVLRGKLKGYDQFSVSLINKDKVDVVYKSSIIYISLIPGRPPMPTRGRQGDYSRQGDYPRPRTTRSVPYSDEYDDNFSPPKKKRFS